MMTLLKQTSYSALTAAILGAALVGNSFAANPTSNTSSFIQYMLPKAQQANRSILAKRDTLVKLAAKHQQQQVLTSTERSWLNNLAKDYKINNADFSKSSTWQQLLKRVDVIPPSLVIAQAANESGWGKSRFARQGNNYFGQWCYRPGCGIVPKRRSVGKTHEVKKYNSAQASVNSYIHSLNTHRAYSELRDLRYQERHADKQPTGKELAHGLDHYSALGNQYVGIIESIITKYNLSQYDRQYT